MSARLYRCMNPKHGPKGNTFEAGAESAVCECGWKWADERIQGTHFHELVILHFDPPTDIPNRGERHLACDPSISVGTNGHRATGVPSVVNCPECKKTAAFQAASVGGDPVFDIPEAVNSVRSGRTIPPDVPEKEV